MNVFGCLSDLDEETVKHDCSSFAAYLHLIVLLLQQRRGGGKTRKRHKTNARSSSGN
jgi:hypothetical protein